MQLNFAITLAALALAMAAPAPVQSDDPTIASDASEVAAPSLAAASDAATSATGASGLGDLPGSPLGGPPGVVPPQGGPAGACSPPGDSAGAGKKGKKGGKPKANPADSDPSQADPGLSTDSSEADSSLAARGDNVNDPRGLISGLKKDVKKVGSGLGKAANFLNPLNLPEQAATNAAGKGLGSALKHPGKAIGSAVKQTGQQAISDAKQVINGCHFVKCGIALGPTVASCVAAAVEEGVNPVADAGCFASVTNDAVNKPAACDKCPLGAAAAVAKGV